MRAILFDKPGDESVLYLGEAAAPLLGAEELRIRVAACAVNRADLVQRQGGYPAPPGASTILGLECAGVVTEVGASVRGFASGERVMALLAGGGYAEEVVVHAGSAMKVPPALSLEEAAAIPEVFLTVFQNVFQLAQLPNDGWLLVHGGGSGIGTASIQLAKRVGARVIVTAGSDAKCEQCRKLGADVAVNYRNAKFVDAVKEATGGRGVDVILDSIGAPYLADNLASLAIGGRMSVIGMMGGPKAELNLGQVLMKRLSIIGSTLRARSVGEKAALVAGFLARFGDDLAAGRIRAVVHRVLPLADAAEAHRALAASEHFGKIVLTP